MIFESELVEMGFSEDLVFVIMIMVLIAISFTMVKFFNINDGKVVIGVFSLITAFLYFYGLLSETYGAIAFMIFAIMIYYEVKLGGQNNEQFNN